ncbi:hypothetical protein DICVIV_01350 [Dictyocaulus viviparus]|uniref:Uncharacterized protein n=1 Tax=Dictyocaulus viviparus TaxID=29172 RepID=A0A0D8Y933_DICVI|nr:hypothetical protein DICVIV_01350 [Dictyocaulus viviparus]
MIKPVVLLAVVVLLVFSDRDPFKCVEDGKCPPGSTCINGTCYGRVDCPQVLMPQLKSGCTMTLEPDENDCPMPKIVCDKELQRCGDIYCERGYACNPDTNTCVMRWDCPMFNVDVNDKCTKMVLDDNDCFTPVDICEQSGTIRQKRAAATKRSTED